MTDTLCALFGPACWLVAAVVVIVRVLVPTRKGDE